MGFEHLPGGHRRNQDKASHVDLLAGARYFGTNAKLQNDVLETGKQDIQWSTLSSACASGCPSARG